MKNPEAKLSWVVECFYEYVGSETDNHVSHVSLVLQIHCPQIHPTAIVHNTMLDVM